MRARLQDNECFFAELREQRYRGIVEKVVRRWRAKVARRRAHRRFIRKAFVSFALKLYFTKIVACKRHPRKKNFTSTIISSARRRKAAVETSGDTGSGGRKLS